MTSSIDSSNPITAENYSFLQNRIYADSGIVLDDTKLYLVSSRLLPIVEREKLSGLDALCAQLRSNSCGSLRQEVVEALTTNETLFFRDPAVFDVLRNTLLPALIERRAASRSIRIWSAAASSGQEAYSIAMLLSELGVEGWNIQILGTDINTRILEQAKAGRYNQVEMNRGLPARLLVKYFTRSGAEWQVKENLRAMVRFQTFDLRQRMRALGAFDLILCRNVLIYFDVVTKKQILSEMRQVMNPQSVLLLGSAETTMNLTDRFSRRLCGQVVVYEAV